MPKPIPVPDKVSQPFWDAVQQRKLKLQYCTKCGKLQYPPQETCTSCHSAEHLEWREVKGRGHILSTYIARDARIKRLQQDLPFNVALITLDEDPGLNFMSNLPGTPVGEVKIGAPVDVTFEELVPGDKGLPIKLIHDRKVVKEK